MPPPGAPAVCYFDVTDIVHYASANARVSGIQRVQFNLLGHMVRRHGGQAVRCMFEHPHRKELFEFNPTPLFESDEFQAEIILRRLGLVGKSRIFPSKPSMRNYLRPYNKNKLRRTTVKADIMLSALLFPRRLAAMGLRRPNAAELAAVPLPLHPITRLPADACFVNLGATWSLPRITEFVRDHAARGGNLVQVIYDLIPHVHPEYFTRSLADDFNRWLAEIVGYTRRFICISRWTAADLRRFVGAREDVRIHAVSMAHEFDGFDRFSPIALSDGVAVEAADAPFVLCVGTLEVRKNGAALLQVWRVLARRLGERLPRLVFAGKQGWLINEFKATLANDPDLAHHVRIVDSPSDRELAYLYQRCLFAAYPSLYEGWGLPVGEAAWFGKYVISSNATSLPEVCGDLIDYFDPADPEALCASLVRAITDPAYVRRKEAAIAASAMRTWSQVADDMYALIVSRSPVTALTGTTTP
ncbi:MAG TPA: glycosyltransferase family 1 protein [Burkholderiaceae bacterium]|nr:glycosyltransferase family 1 protein [Burkholderiaceae bacterium]